MLVGMLFAMAPIADAITIDQARAKALRATKSERAHGGVILFNLAAPVRQRAVIREFGRRDPEAGLHTRTMPLVLRAGERSYFFYVDRGAYQAYGHAGRVLLVGAATGRIRRSRLLRFAPVIDGRLPGFLQDSDRYLARASRVAATPYSVRRHGTRSARSAARGRGRASRARPRRPDSERLAAARLGAEHACLVTVGGRASDLGSLGSASGTAVMPRLVFAPSSKVPLPSFITSHVIRRSGCRDVAIVISGDGYRILSRPIVRTHASTSGSQIREYHVSATMLRRIIRAHPSVTFELIVDAPGSGGFVAALRPLRNVLLVTTSSSTGQRAYRYLPSKRVGAVLERNPIAMRTDSSFLTSQIAGAATFTRRRPEVVHAATEVGDHSERSFLTYLLARGFALSRKSDFTADLGATQRLYTAFRVTPPGPVNRAPLAIAQVLVTPRGAPLAITLAGTDPDGDPLTFAVVGGPARGTLSGTGANVTYQPAKEFVGADSWTFSVSDGSLVSAPATISITVTPTAVAYRGSLHSRSAKIRAPHTAALGAS